MSDWNLEIKTANVTSWSRSWRQELFTDLGADWTLVAHMEKVKVLDDGTVIHQPDNPVIRKMSQVMSDSDVQELNAILTRLIKKWYDEDTGVGDGNLASDVAENDTP